MNRAISDVLAISRLSRVAAVLTILTVAVFYIATIRAGQGWGSDFSMYIHHAKNISQGIDYRHTGYIYDHFRAEVGPRAYPPIWPLLLSPTFRWFGLDLWPMKVEVIVFWILALATIYRLLRDDKSFGYPLVVVAILGFNPLFWEFKDTILSDIPFLFFVYLSMVLVNKAEQSRTRRHAIMYALATGCTLYLATGTRTIGVVLVIALVVYGLMTRRRVSVATIAGTAAFLLPFLAQTTVFGSNGGYLDQLSVAPATLMRTLLGHLVPYANAPHILWKNGYSNGIATALFLVISLCAAMGFVRKAYEGVSYPQVFAVVYTVAILLWPATDVERFILPVVPLYLYYALIGVKALAGWHPPRLEPFAVLILLLVVAGTYAGWYTTADFGAMTSGVDTPTTTELFHYVNADTRSDSVFIFYDPRTLALYTDRQASIYHPTSDDNLWRYIREIGASYIIVGRIFPEDQTVLHPFVTRSQQYLTLTYTNRDFDVFRITDRPHVS
ncbi:MAG: ArnT family glycosyltransferase [Dehalococcoidia bacterium]